MESARLTVFFRLHNAAGQRKVVQNLREVAIHAANDERYSTAASSAVIRGSTAVSTRSFPACARKGCTSSTLPTSAALRH